MLKTDFNGYKEFKEKLANTRGECESVHGTYSDVD